MGNIIFKYLRVLEEVHDGKLSFTLVNSSLNDDAGIVGRLGDLLVTRWVGDSCFDAQLLFGEKSITKMQRELVWSIFIAF